jgi:hypothetical protein
MTDSEFKAWLEGYMLDRANPDPKVIAAKAAELRPDAPIYSLPYIPSTRPAPYWDHMKPYVTCGDPIGTIGVGGITAISAGSH